MLNHSLTITSWFNLVHTHNRGIAFGMFANSEKTIFIGLLILAILTSIGLLAYLIIIPNKPKYLNLATSLALGGAAGNIFDKITRYHVIDFIDIHWQQYHWPQFNLADSFIVLAALIYTLNYKPAPKKITAI